MTVEIFWLIVTALVTSLFWVPYILNRIAVRGLMGAMANPSAGDKPQPDWAVRAQKAHYNAVENLVIFAALVLAAGIVGVSTPVTAAAAWIYFVARVVHYVVYVAGIPVLRTLSFAVAWACEVAIALVLLGLL
ncbi:MAG: MAPEG family protein [Flavobacteriaceae bacterium]